MIYHDIISENSEHHWPFLDTKNKIVLDLGCGRHDTSIFEQSSPIYFGNKGAKKIIALDARQGEIDYFNSNNPDPEKYVFGCKMIENTNDILSLIKEYQIDVLKIDIEGYENRMYDLTKDDMSNISDLGIEYHSLEILDKITEKIEEWGFKIDVKARFAFVEASHMGVLFCTRK